MSFKISDINILISSFLPREDIVSLLKSSRELRSDLHNIPFKHFVFSQWAGINEIKAMLTHLDVIETLEINSCDFVTEILFPMKRLKIIILENCRISYTTTLVNTILNRIGKSTRIVLKNNNKEIVLNP